jgi:aerobic-type carbon monoxide dehydrogenase small subunit (CoxS/CutS family)
MKLSAFEYASPATLEDAVALLTDEPNADKARKREVLSGNICRCTGYIPIVEAVYEARGAYQSGETGAKS